MVDSWFHPKLGTSAWLPQLFAKKYLQNKVKGIKSSNNIPSKHSKHGAKMAFDVRNSLACLNSGLCLACSNIILRNEIHIIEYPTAFVRMLRGGSRCLNKSRKSLNLKFANWLNTNTPMPDSQMYHQRIKLHIQHIHLISFDHFKMKHQK